MGVLAVTLRSTFAPAHLRALADAEPDTSIPLMNGMPMPGVTVTKLMVDLLDVGPGQRVLVIGTGSGFQTAYLAEHTGATVDSLDIRAIVGLEQKMPAGVTLYCMDGLQETPPEMYDAILCTCAVPAPMLCWVPCLNQGGRVVAPVGSREGHALRKFVRVGLGLSDVGDFAYCKFVEGEMLVEPGKPISIFDITQ